MASTRTDEETRRRALALGARQFLGKPVAPEELAGVVSRLIAPPEDPTPRADREEES
jgi:DNA-binding response OmpR family regulator